MGDGRILGMPERNVSGCEIIFTGNPKRAVLKGDPLDGTTEIGSSFGRKAIVCVMPQRRLVRQPSLRTWGACRYDLWRAKSQPDMKAAQIQPEKASDDKTYVFG